MLDFKPGDILAVTFRDRPAGFGATVTELNGMLFAAKENGELVLLDSLLALYDVSLAKS